MKRSPSGSKALVAGERRDHPRCDRRDPRGANAGRPRSSSAHRNAASLLAQANSACARLELALTRIKQVEHELVEADLATLRQRLANLTSRPA